MQPRGAHVDMRGLHGPGRLHCGSSWHSWESASLGVETRKGRGSCARGFVVGAEFLRVGSLVAAEIRAYDGAVNGMVPAPRVRKRYTSKR